MPTIDSMLIDKMGGTKKVAQLFKIKEPSVTQWRTRGIPAKRRAAFSEPLPWVISDWKREGKTND